MSEEPVDDLFTPPPVDYSLFAEGANRAKQPTLEEMTGSDDVCLDAAFGMHIGVVHPVGYETVAEHIRTHQADTTDVQCFWLLVEANKASKTAGLEKDFPDVRQRAYAAVTHLTKTNPGEIEAIYARISLRNPLFVQARKGRKIVNSFNKAVAPLFSALDSSSHPA